MTAAGSCFLSALSVVTHHPDPSLQLIFEKEGVYLHTNAKRSHQDTTLPGFIRIVERVSRPGDPLSPAVVGIIMMNDDSVFLLLLFF